MIFAGLKMTEYSLSLSQGKIKNKYDEYFISLSKETSEIEFSTLYLKSLNLTPDFFICFVQTNKKHLTKYFHLVLEKTLFYILFLVRSRLVYNYLY